MNAAKQWLLVGGIMLVLLGMGHGLWYALFAEHQALDGIGASLSAGFAASAERDAARSEQALRQYRQRKYVYDRQVDAHGHWIGLGLLLMVLAFGFNRVGFSERTKRLLAGALFVGVLLFPLGVLLQTQSHGPLPQALAVLGSGLTIASLAAITIGFARAQTA